jgi:hypothetical protein
VHVKLADSSNEMVGDHLLPFFRYKTLGFKCILAEDLWLTNIRASFDVFF